MSDGVIKKVKTYEFIFYKLDTCTKNNL